jgi:hypothetical protein
MWPALSSKLDSPALVSSVNIMGSDKIGLLTVGERSFIHVMKSKGPRTDALGTPV